MDSDSCWKGEASTATDQALESRDVPTLSCWEGLALSPSLGFAQHFPLWQLLGEPLDLKYIGKSFCSLRGKEYM